MVFIKLHMTCINKIIVFIIELKWSIQLVELETGALSGPKKHQNWEFGQNQPNWLTSQHLTNQFVFILY